MHKGYTPYSVYVNGKEITLQGSWSKKHFQCKSNKEALYIKEIMDKNFWYNINKAKIIEFLTSDASEEEKNNYINLLIIEKTDK